ncbi:MAG: hypothetical protein LBT46_13510 [Planctomycetaceae bacterium]|nr:hypothetical protein [Planctomycetaceae bacterium]
MELTIRNSIEPSQMPLRLIPKFSIPAKRYACQQARGSKSNRYLAIAALDVLRMKLICAILDCGVRVGYRTGRIFKAFKIYYQENGYDQSVLFS